ncbi:DUF4253 domain-containing protein [Spirillospora sp. CA-253888]
MLPADPFAGLPGGLPPGRLITPDPGFVRNMGWTLSHERPVLWVTDKPVRKAHALWSRLYAERAETDLYPLLLDTLHGDAARPWHNGELGPAPQEAIDALSAEDVLRTWWEPADSEDLEILEPMDSPWSGLADPAVLLTDPDDQARDLAKALARRRRTLVGLVPAARGADTLALMGWAGPCNHTNDTEEISAVVRSWEERFGARVVMVGYATLFLSVAAPPRTLGHAREVANEHFVFCMDNIAQGEVADFDEYAETLVGRTHWSFWWD